MVQNKRISREDRKENKIEKMMVESEYWRTEDGLTLIQAWSRDGMNTTEIAQRIGVSQAALYKWRKTFPEIADAMAVGKELLDYKVENALLKAALGYKTKEVKVTLGKKIINGESYEVLKETTTKEVGPNAVACLAWLNNRKHEQWKRNRDKVVEYNEEDSNVTVTIIRGKGEDGVNNGVKVERKKPEEIPEEDAERKNSMDEWPDDWEEESDSQE